MLRLYRADDKVEPVWRLSLENPLTQERMGFASLADLFTFLQHQLGMVPDASQEPVSHIE